MCLSEYDLSEFGLHCAGGVRSSHASPAVSRVDWGSSIGQSSRDGSRTVIGHSFAGSGYGSRRSVAAGRQSDADKFGPFEPVYAFAAEDGIEVDREVPRSSGFSGGGSGGRCSWASCPPRFRSDGGDGAVAALVGSDTATLSVLDYAGLGSPYWTWIVYIFAWFR